VGFFCWQVKVFLFAAVLVVWTGSGVHPASYPVGSGFLSFRVKQLRYESVHSPPSGADVKNGWSYTSISIYICMTWYLIKYQG
jgi:hypothetical protein